MEEDRRKVTDPDDFWDLSALLPSRAARPRQAPLPVTHPPAEIRAESTAPSSAAPGATSDVPLTRRFVPPHTAEELNSCPTPDDEYIPENALIRHVRIYRWQTEYTYYEAFCRHAAKLASFEGTPCEEVDFFSYMPQYTQMDRAQLSYYFWWRTNFKKGVVLPAAYSYLLLYLYELINLPDLDPHVGQGQMLSLWLSYRGRYPKLDTLVREWICDYSLLHHLPPPKLPTQQYGELLSGCRLREFFVPPRGDALKSAVLLFCNNYDFTKSKFYRPDTKEHFHRVLGGAVDVALAYLHAEHGERLTDSNGISTLRRDAFQGAICSYRNKRRIEVDYTSFSHTHELRYIITDVLKYAENALRGVLGVKSRLTVYSVSVPLRARLDAYLAGALPPRRPRGVGARPVEIPVYERQYDRPHVELSLSRAAEIEQESWQTTKRLVEAFGGEQHEESPQTVREKCQSEQKSTETVRETAEIFSPRPQPALQGGDKAKALLSANDPWEERLGALVEFLPLCQASDRAAQRDFALSHRMMLDAIADKINTVAGDILGDILLEEVDGAYVLIPDYIDDLKNQGVL